MQSVLCGYVSRQASYITKSDEKCNVYWVPDSATHTDHNLLNSLLANKHIATYSVESEDYYYIMDAECAFTSISNMILTIYMIYRQKPLNAIYITDYEIIDGNLNIYVHIDKSLGDRHRLANKISPK